MNENEMKNLNKTNINWYPGHMKKTKEELVKNMPIIDIVYELVDARIPYSSKIKDIDSIIKNKKRILIMTKKDLCDLEVTNKWIKYYEKEGYNVLLVDLNNGDDYKSIVSLTDKLCKDINNKRLLAGLKSKEIKACVIGIPNVGKSTLINKLAGKKTAKVGNLPGITKNISWLKTKYKLLILDTPGILWPKIDEKIVGYNLASLSAINEDIIPINDVSYYILKTLEKYYPTILKERFNINKITEDSYNLIAANIGAKKNDYERVSKFIINELKSGRIKGITFDHEKN